MRQVVYSIQGNIGAGKSSLLRLLQAKMPNIVIAPQPVAEWQQCSSHNLLEHYYKDTHRWAYTFQNYALLTRSNCLHNLLKNANLNKSILFSERSIVGDKEIFAKMMFNEKKMSSMEYQLYLRFYDHLAQLYSPPLIHKHIYLRTDPKLCLKRIQKRGRKGEQSIDIKYLNVLNQLHEDWLGATSICVVEGNKEFQTEDSELRRIMEQMNQLLVKDQHSPVMSPILV